MNKRILVVAGVVASMWSGLAAQQPSLAHELGIKYMRDSEEYATLARQTYRLAGEAVTRAAGNAGPWAVVLDVDETALDNSTYQLERAAYSVPFEPQSWNACVETEPQYPARWNSSGLCGVPPAMWRGFRIGKSR
jgi:predicted secreted acid phosphatase